MGRDKEKSSLKSCGDLIPGDNRFLFTPQMDAWLGQVKQSGFLFQMVYMNNGSEERLYA